MRRMSALVAAVVLGVSLAGSSLAAAPVKHGFTGDFAQLAEDGTVTGWVVAQLGQPSDQHLVPGTFDYTGAPGTWVRESHTVIATTSYWYDPGHEGGSNVAYADGVECIYLGVGDASCHEWAVMFIDPVDGSKPNQIAYSHVRDGSGAFDFNPETGQAWWFTVGRGDFVLKGTPYPVG